MAGKHVTLVGFEDTIRALRNVPEVTRARLVDTIDVSKRELSTFIARAAPYRTGALREAYAPSTRRGLTGFVGIRGGEIRGQRPEIYWRMVEFGTVKMAAQPHIVPTTERYADTLIARIRRTGQDIERDLSSRGQRFL